MSLFNFLEIINSIDLTVLPTVSRRKFPFLISHPIDHFPLPMKLFVSHLGNKIITKHVNRYVIQIVFSGKLKRKKQNKKTTHSGFTLIFLSFSNIFHLQNSYISLKVLHICNTVSQSKGVKPSLD